ncbi:MAG: isoprenylcysteine carboxyl methyltransferase [Alphaproteobacteria bacterium]|nr:MAG: isoprenylcysteine carboxyl methyltransferase [Alphaproteobacteria bacterium]
MTDSTPPAPTRIRRPTSCVSLWATPIGLVLLLVLAAAAIGIGAPPVATCAVAVLLLTVVLGGMEIGRHPPPAYRRRMNLPRVACKLLGMTLTLAVLAFGYWLFPLYRWPLYQPFFEALEMFWPVFAVLVTPYFLDVDRRMKDPYDAYWLIGRMALGRLPERGSGPILRRHVLGWLVKGYFLPLMFGDLAHGAIWLFQFSWSHLLSYPFVTFFTAIFQACMAIELAFVATGYLASLRLFDAHIRSVDETLLGWLAALACYAPLLEVTFTQYLGYRDGDGWAFWLQDHPTLLVVWGSLILVLMVLHTWCDSVFGVRFSNLTHRGVITNGPFRLGKHPAYVIKNLRWWMVSLPFLSMQGVDGGLRQSVLLALVGALYVLRAWTEERHLSRDPAYVAYALWIDRHGLLSWVGTLFPRLSYAHIHQDAVLRAQRHLDTAHKDL